MTNDPVGCWSVGLLVATLGGYIGTALFHWAMYWWFELPPKTGPNKRVAPGFTGVVERFVFAVFVGLNVSGIAPGMMTWLVLKLATNWNRPGIEDPAEAAEAKARAFPAILSGLVSMLFALIGGYICRGCKPFS